MKALLVAVFIILSLFAIVASPVHSSDSSSAPVDSPDSIPTESLPLNLPLAVQIALERNPSFLNASATDQIADSSLRSSRDAYSLRLDLSGGERRTTDQDSADDPSDRRTVDYGDIALSRAFASTGGRLTAFSELYRTRFNDGDPNTDESRDTTHSYGLRLTQPLLKNAWAPVSSTPLVQSRMSRETAANSFELSRRRLILSVIEIYYSAVRAGRMVTVAEHGLAEADTHLTHTRIKFEEGLVARIDVSQADIQYLRQQTALLSARQSADDARDALRRLLFLPGDTPLALDESVDFEPETIEIDSAVREALMNRLEIQTLQNELRSAELDAKVAWNSRLPALDLQLEARSEQQNDGSGDLIDDYPRAYAMELGLKWTLGDKTPREAYLRAGLRRRIVQNELHALTREITDEVKRAVRHYETLKRTIDVTRRSVELAEYALDLANQSYTEGLIRSTDLLKAQDDLLAQQNDYVSAIMDFVAAKANILLALGRPIDASHIRLNPAESPESPQDQRPDDPAPGTLAADTPLEDDSE